MVKIFNIEFMQQAIVNSTPQPHRSKWSDKEDKMIADCIENGLSLTDIHRIISLRSLGAIRTRANSLGYGFYRNKDDGLTYFHNEINHKYRRTKGEIMEGKEFVSVPESNDSESNIEIASDIIPKIEINPIDLDIIIEILTTVRSNGIAAKTSSNAAGGDI